MSHYDIVSAFGKMGTYLLDHPRNTLKRNIPSKLANSFKKNPVQKIITLAMDSDDDYFCYWDVRTGGKHWAHSTNFEHKYTSFYNWWKSSRNSDVVSLTIGTDANEYLAWAPSGARFRYGTTGKLYYANENLLKAKIRNAAYGVGGANVLIFANGGLNWSCLGQYPDLEKLLKKQKWGDVISIAMSPYRGNEYFVVLANAEVHIRASAIVERDIVSLLEAYPNMEVISSTLVKRDTTVKTSVGLPRQARRKEFLTGIANSVITGTASAVVAAAFGACSVM